MNFANRFDVSAAAVHLPQLQVRHPRLSHGPCSLQTGKITFTCGVPTLPQILDAAVVGF